MLLTRHGKEVTILQLEGKMAGNGCSLRQKFPNKEIWRWNKGGEGMFARRIGGVLQAFHCVPRVAPIMKMDSCFAEIPLWVDESVQFKDVKTPVSRYTENRSLATMYYPCR